MEAAANEDLGSVESSSEADSFEVMSNSDEEYTPAPVPPRQTEDMNPLRAMLNKVMFKSETGRKILEDEKQKKEAERIAKIPKVPEKPPSPKFKTEYKLRSTFPAP